MNSPADVRIIDAHSESDGSDDHLYIVANERFLIVAPGLRLESRVIRKSSDAVGLQLRRDFVDAAARQAVDDSGATCARLRQQFTVTALGFRAHTIEQIGAVETRQVYGGIAQRQLSHDVGSHPRRGGGGESQNGNQGMPAAESG